MCFNHRKLNISAKENTNQKEESSLVRFFSRWFWIGLVLILGSILWESLLNNYEIKNPSSNIDSTVIFCQNIGIKLTSTLGISIFLGAIFNWIIGTQTFSKYVKEKIINVLISRDYIAELDLSKKRSMLEAIITPSKDFASIYSRIGKYFESFVNKSMSLFCNQQFRSNLNLQGTACYDGNKVCVKYSVDFKSYVLGSAENDVKVGFSDESSKLNCTKISLPDEKAQTFNPQEVNDDKGVLGQDCTTKRIYDVKDFPDKYKYSKILRVERDIVEYGEDHWINFSYRSSKPLDGMNIIIRCEKDLVIKQAIPYGPFDAFEITTSDDKKEIKVVCNQWMDPGLGVNILIAKEDLSSTHS